MKKILFTFIMLFSIIATSQSEKTYQLDTKKSKLKWTGYYQFYFSEHTGTVNFTKGSLTTNFNKITGGSFEIDMKTITNEEHEKGIGPVAHLMDEDFFDVEKYPKATLEITKVEYFESENKHKFYADLTLKEITKPIVFWGTADGNTRTLTTRFKLDRTDWGINYNNKIKNEAISNAMGFETILYF
ncbi:YceI family protein [Patiriisocius hiemis]|uniref:YceI family protein n=1 Tax=Patiriisocius hiemis TaxID=3075604 RepID=A0ABU2YB34_9FLAO|nr:YceI family protein [Constantimarinum sp. W242]MDT0554834.1 YceI family protein [Constantimarinum sp. W242]